MNYATDAVITDIRVLQIHTNSSVPLAKRMDKSYAYGFNGMERDDAIAGSGNHYTTEFRQYDSRLGRWLSRDPIFHPNMSPYNSFDNSPIVFVDPRGSNAGKFSDEKGNIIGDDGQDNKDVHIVTDRKERRNIKKNDDNGLTTPLDQVKSAVTLPSKPMRQEMARADEMDKLEPFNEHGGIFGIDAEGNQRVVWAKPGPTADPRDKDGAEINVFDAANPEEQGILVEVQGTFHNHQSGSVETIEKKEDPFGGSTTFGATQIRRSFFEQVPSSADITNQVNRVANGVITGDSYVIMSGDQEVVINRAKGENVTISLSVWKTVGE